MNDKDIFKDIFSEKLGNYEANVDPQLWNAISSKLAASAVTTGSTVGTTLFTKLLIGGSISAATLVGGYFVFSDSYQTPNRKGNITHVSSNSESKKEEKERNTEATQMYSIPRINESNNTVSKDSKKVNINEVNNDDRLNLFLSNHSFENLPYVELAPEIVNTEIPKQIEPITFTSENKKQDELVKKPIVEPNNNDQEEATISTEEVVLYENIFTPNGDGVNDLFFIKTKGLTDFSIVIMNTKNTVVFKSNDPDFVWDGIGMNGEPVEEGKYLYYLTSYDKNGKPVNKYRELTIKRN